MFVESVGANLHRRSAFFTRPFALMLLIEMLVITFKVQLPNGWFFSVQGGGAGIPRHVGTLVPRHTDTRWWPSLGLTAPSARNSER